MCMYCVDLALFSSPAPSLPCWAALMLGFAPWRLSLCTFSFSHPSLAQGC
jgi:hypothetical protein